MKWKRRMGIRRKKRGLNRRRRRRCIADGVHALSCIVDFFLPFSGGSFHLDPRTQLETESREKMADTDRGRLDRKTRKRVRKKRSGGCRERETDQRSVRAENRSLRNMIRETCEHLLFVNVITQPNEIKQINKKSDIHTYM